MTALIRVDQVALLSGRGQPSSFALPRSGLVTITSQRQEEVTLLLRQLLGVIPVAIAEPGRLELFAKPVAYFQASGERQVWLRTRAALIQRGTPLLSVVSALQNVVTPLLYHGGLTQQRSLHTAGQWLDYVGFDGDEQALPANLTALQRLQVALARSLSLSPAIVAIESPWRDIDSQDMPALTRTLARLSEAYLLLCKAPVTPLIEGGAGRIVIDQEDVQFYPADNHRAECGFASKQESAANESA